MKTVLSERKEGRDPRALLLARNAGAGGTVTAEGGEPPCGVDGSAGVCELLCDLDDLLEAEAMLRGWSPKSRHLLGDVVVLADELARKRELENARRRELVDEECRQETERRSSLVQLRIEAGANVDLAPSAG